MTEYGYSYIELPPHSSVERAREIRDLNVANSMLWDRWRAENAPTAQDMATEVAQAWASTDGSGRNWLWGQQGVRS